MNSALHIAILDDEVDITQLLANYLQSHGYRVTQLHDGQSLMETTAADPPSLVLLDLGLPGKDGFWLGTGCKLRSVAHRHRARTGHARHATRGRGATPVP